MSQSEQVSGNEKRKIRSTTRLYAIQALFQMEQLGLSTDEVVDEVETETETEEESE
jgi:N utilization substance protein B